MDAYVYGADLYCADCGEDMLRDLSWWPQDRRDDSDQYPQGPYANGGGAGDFPKHCGDCGVFLENPLTSDGYEYVKEKLHDWEVYGRGMAHILLLWATYYDLPEPPGLREQGNWELDTILNVTSRGF